MTSLAIEPVFITLDTNGFGNVIQTHNGFIEYEICVKC